LLTASTPVIAVHPLAKTLSRIQSGRSDVPIGNRGGAMMGDGCPPAANDRMSPMAMT
jgi:hypothetical protein